MTATFYTESPSVKRRLRPYTANGYTFQMVQVQKGGFHFFRGDHEIILPADFELGQHLVTQGLWEAVMGKNFSHFKSTNRPVEKVSWDDIMGTEGGTKLDKSKEGFLDRLNALPEISALNAADDCCFGLPSEAQWEYAASCGRYRQAFGYEYAGSNYMPEVGWCSDNSNDQIQLVGHKLSNVLKLYDMSGSVWEWCEDIWQDDYKCVPTNGAAWTKDGDENIRVVRGGSWNYIDLGSRVAVRNWVEASFRRSNVGFRLARYHKDS